MAKIKMKRDEVAITLQALIGIESKQEKVTIGKEEKLLRTNWPVYFQYFVDRNRTILMSLVNSMNNETHRMTIEYEKRREELNIKYAMMDAGKPMIENHNYIIPEESKKDYNEAQTQLRKDFQHVFTALDAFGKEEIELDIHQINFSRIENLELPSGSFALIKSLVNMEN